LSPCGLGDCFCAPGLPPAPSYVSRRVSPDDSPSSPPPPPPPPLPLYPLPPVGPARPGLRHLRWPLRHAGALCLARAPCPPHQGLGLGRLGPSCSCRSCACAALGGRGQRPGIRPPSPPQPDASSSPGRVQPQAPAPPPLPPFQSSSPHFSWCGWPSCGAGATAFWCYASDSSRRFEGQTSTGRRLRQTSVSSLPSPSPSYLYVVFPLIVPQDPARLHCWIRRAAGWPRPAAAAGGAAIAS
ncbi:hypothetical protein B484DRAFT_192084, partial [Ochromonadaceae sp. CCMP2298]